LDEFMDSITHREYLMRLEWLDDQWNKPDRHDYYAMQIAQKIVQTRRKRSVSLESLKIPIKLVKKTIKSVAQKVSDSLRDAQIAASKARWGMMVKKPPPKELLAPRPVSDRPSRGLRDPDDDNSTMID
jgi:hypothetical protein